MLPKIIETKVTGEATVLQLFDITGKAKQIIKVAGCRVVNGLVEKQKLTRVIRNGHVIHEGNPPLDCVISVTNQYTGSLDTMRQLKKEITEARKGTECGLTLKEFSDLQEGDLIQMYERIEKPGVI
jgi:translation initiation factor IF-2